MAKKLTITDDQVIEAAEKHRQSADVLKTLFPIAFKDYNKISLRYADLTIEDRGGLMMRKKDDGKLLLSTSHQKHGYALTLNTHDFDWTLKDDQLTPTTKIK